MDVLRAQGFDPGLPTLFVWEGVVYYLRPESVAETLESLVARCAAGSELLFDYSLRSFVDGDESTYGGRTMQRWLKRNGERFLFGLERHELPAYLRRFRLSLDEDTSLVA